MEFDASQLRAIEHARHHRFAVINGGAGCGKTTIIREICNSGSGFELCAFTGKAAARMREAIGRGASTIHSLLEYNGSGFRLDSLRGKRVIIDEASMVNSLLLAEIVKRKPEQLILVGDQAQLPPIGVGQPFHDIVRLFPESVNTLAKSYRNNEAIYRAALQIREGKTPAKFDETASEKWSVLATGNAEETQAAILEWVRQGMFDFERDIILCPKNGETDDETGKIMPGSVAGLNAEIVKIVNPRPASWKWRFYPGDRIINTKNMASLDIWNGTTGNAAAIDEKKNLFLEKDPLEDEEKKQVKLNPEIQRELRHAYALTVHKSQGSQYRKVVFVCLNRDRFLLDRALLYTAVTRTKRECYIVGEPSAMEFAIRTVKHKTTCMQLLLEGA